ncbi:NAD(P)-binding protein [Ganoderma leucocontextum]|nr:NAD(P)-binding protein [Ganoderma leucocontextum]
MPPATSGKVLVTGANGFIASWIIQDLLEHGFSVRAVVRSAEKVEGLREVLAAHGDRLESVVVQDIQEKNAFDEAVKDVDAIIHTASPVHVSAPDPEELIGPAVQGTTSILHSASLPGSSVKRIVVLSSIAAVIDHTRPMSVIFTEADWNDRAVAEVREKDTAASPGAKYSASKVLAERAAWDLFLDGRESGTIGWDLVTLCPSVVFGPALGVRSPKDLSYSVGAWYHILVKEDSKMIAWIKSGWTDVRDLSVAARLALTKPEAGGERFTICTAPLVWRQWVGIAHRLLGKSKPEDTVEDFSNVVHDVQIDNTKSREVLGVQYHDMEATAAFMIEDFKQKGWC